MLEKMQEFKAFLIGNAVPVNLAKHIGLSIKDYLQKAICNGI